MIVLLKFSPSNLHRLWEDILDNAVSKAVDSTNLIVILWFFYLPLKPALSSGRNLLDNATAWVIDSTNVIDMFLCRSSRRPDSRELQRSHREERGRAQVHVDTTHPDQRKEPNNKKETGRGEREREKKRGTRESKRTKTERRGTGEEKERGGETNKQTRREDKQKGTTRRNRKQKEKKGGEKRKETQTKHSNHEWCRMKCNMGMGLPDPLSRVRA